jgi:hypothetical protein
MNLWFCSIYIAIHRFVMKFGSRIAVSSIRCPENGCGIQLQAADIQEFASPEDIQRRAKLNAQSTSPY